jgi:hypothetical protein
MKDRRDQKNIRHQNYVTGGLSVLYAKLVNFVNGEPDRFSVRQIKKMAQRLPDSTKMQMIALCGRILRHPNIGQKRYKTIRIGTVKTLLSYWPGSMADIRRLLKKHTRSADYEVHFTIFCFLDELPNINTVREDKEHLLELIKRYIVDSQSDRGLSLWKAAEMLGWHWRLKDALPILIEACIESRGIHSREAGLEGLGYVLKRPDLDIATRKKILSLLERTVKEDKSLRIKRSAMFILGDERHMREHAISILKHIAKSYPAKTVREEAKFILSWTCRTTKK